MRALVTGCAGFIGSHLTESLLSDGWTAVGVDCFNDNYGRRDKLRNLDRAMEWDGFEFVPIDLSRGNLHDLVEGVDVVFHLAAEPGVRPSWGARFEDYMRNNVLATQHLLEALLQGQPGARLVYASSSSVYGHAERFPTAESDKPRPFSPYGMTKLGGEHLCDAYHLNHGLDTVTLRYFSVYGPRQRPDMAFALFCKRILAGEPITILGDGGQTRDFTYVGDVVRATRLAAELDGVAGEIINVGGGSQVALRDAVRLLESHADRAAQIEYQPTAPGEVRHTRAATARASELLGFEPQVNLDEGLRRQVDWVRSTLALTAT